MWAWRAVTWFAGSLCVAAVVGILAAYPPGSVAEDPVADAEGRAQEQVTGVAAAHRSGQTFITWRELDPPPGDTLTSKEFIALRRSLATTRRIRYRVYRSEQPITRLATATLIGEALPLSAWNGEFFGANPPPDAVLTRYVIEDGEEALAPGTGLFVFNTPRQGRAYYAVTVSIAGAERQTLTPKNTVQVDEALGPAAPVLQRIEKRATFVYVENPTLRFYTRWEPPGNSSPPGRSFDYLVGIPPTTTDPAPVGLHLHEWNGSLRWGFGWWYGTARTQAVLVSTNQIPYDWWTGYHERFRTGTLNTPSDWRSGVVRPFTQTRLLSFVDWLATTMKLDLSRMFTAGSSMGGSGAIMLAIRHPARVAWSISWVGVHVPAASPAFRASYELVFGKPEWGVKFEDGTPVWDYFNDVRYLRQHPDRDIGFITFSNGKNDAGIGWTQAVDFLKALQETRQPHMFVWGQERHGQRAIMPGNGGQRIMPMDLRTDQSLPAFSRGTLDDDPGTGTPVSGDPAGQVNAFLVWQTDTIIDEPQEWSLVVRIAGRTPRSDGFVDVTPRRLQRFKLRAGETVAWTVERGRKVVQSGEATADSWGLVTVPQVLVTRDGTRLTIRRKPASSDGAAVPRRRLPENRF